MEKTGRGKVEEGRGKAGVGPLARLYRRWSRADAARERDGLPRRLRLLAMTGKEARRGEENLELRRGCILLIPPRRGHRSFSFFILREKKKTPPVSRGSSPRMPCRLNSNLHTKAGGSPKFCFTASNVRPKPGGLQSADSSRHPL